jgi:dipeptidyl aminopeptidase/acylaminoacyl peptidase
MPTAKKRPLQPADAFLHKQVFDPQVSPDGRLVAYTVIRHDADANERQMSVFVAPLDGRTPARRFTYGKHDHSPRWSPDGRSLAFISERGEKNQVFLAPLDGGEARQLTKETHGAMDPVWSPDGRRIAYVARAGEHKDAKQRNAAEKAAPRVIRNLRYRLDGIGYFDERRTHVFVADVDTGVRTQVTDGDWFDGQPSWSPDGKTIAFTSDREPQRHQRQFRADVWVAPSTGGRARRLSRGRGNASTPVFSPDGRWVAYAGHEHGDAGGARHTHVLVVPAAGGAAPRSISESLDRSVAALLTGGMTWSRDSRSVVFPANDGGAVSLYRARLDGGSIERVLGGQRQVQGFSVAPDGRRVAIAAAFSSQPSEIYAAMLGGGARERNLSHANDELIAAAELAPTRRITARAPDGGEVEAFVLFPPGYRPGRRYPLVLDIHGGPNGVHPGGFMMRPQALAAAGYVVAMPNPRGSLGYGEAFMHAVVNDWGGGDFDDLMAVVDRLVRRGVADPERLFVMGYSYGGFMTAWTIGQTDRFRAALIGAPVADHIAMRGTSDIPMFSDYHIGGSPYDNAEEWRARSPVTHLPNVTAAVLIEHHEGDMRCPIGQAEEIFQNLKLLGKEVEFLRYPGGAHGWHTHAPSQDVDLMTRAIAWFDAHGGKPKASPSRNGASRARIPGARRAKRARRAKARA